MRHTHQAIVHLIEDLRLLRQQLGHLLSKPLISNRLLSDRQNQVIDLIMSILHRFGVEIDGVIVPYDLLDTMQSPFSASREQGRDRGRSDCAGDRPPRHGSCHRTDDGAANQDNRRQQKLSE
jgi:hypothetical protein